MVEKHTAESLLLNVFALQKSGQKGVGFFSGGWRLPISNQKTEVVATIEILASLF